MVAFRGSLLQNDPNLSSGPLIWGGTKRGAQVGDSEKSILRLYKGQVKVSPHTYVDSGHYLTIKSKDGRYALVFETDGGVVTSFRIGLLPAAEYIEGCS